MVRHHLIDEVAQAVLRCVSSRSLRDAPINLHIPAGFRPLILEIAIKGPLGLSRAGPRALRTSERARGGRVMQAVLLAQILSSLSSRKSLLMFLAVRLVSRRIPCRNDRGVET